jgi:Ankyrin repeats (many copies)
MCMCMCMCFSVFKTAFLIYQTVRAQDGTTALILAVQDGRTDTVMILLDNGADVHATLPVR